MAPVNDEAKKHNQNLPGMGGIYNTVNFHLYHYAGNNPVKYTDPDGKVIYAMTSFFQMNKGPWQIPDTRLNRTNTKIAEQGCAVTGLANVATTESQRRGGSLFKDSVSPPMLNKSSNFIADTDNLNWESAAASVGLIATRSTIGDSEAAQSMVISAAVSPKMMYVLVQVPITTSKGDSLHWIGVNGTPKDLNGDGELWLSVSPTSINDNKARITNSNWQQDSDGNLYVKLKAVTGAVTLE